MKNQKVVITGAGSGLGRSLAQQLAAKGAQVYLLGRTKEKLNKVAATIGSAAEVYSLDVRKPSEIKQVFSEINPVDILINNAGIGSFALTEELSTTEVNKVIDTNLKGTIFCS